MQGKLSKIKKLTLRKTVFLGGREAFDQSGARRLKNRQLAKDPIWRGLIAKAHAGEAILDFAHKLVANLAIGIEFHVATALDD